MQLLSTVFQDGGEIPTRYTCEGEDISVPLSWVSVPEKTKSLVLIIEDPDAPDPAAPKIVWIHWVIYNLDPSIESIVENISEHQLPEGTLFGLTSWNKKTYGGPCPPIGRHRYFHKLYALDVKLPNLENPTVNQLKNAMNGHILAEAVLMGTYQKKK